jgi:23S rRNA-/tRNA-specific pseudouridylate synthase
MTDNKRTYDQYHLYIKLYANNTAYAAEFFGSGKVDRDEKIVWKYNNSTQKIFMDWKNGGEIDAYIKGNTNNFNATTTWSNGKQSITNFSRISKEEMNCMDRKGKYVNNQCIY